MPYISFFASLRLSIKNKYSCFMGWLFLLLVIGLAFLVSYFVGLAHFQKDKKKNTSVSSSNRCVRVSEDVPGIKSLVKNLASLLLLQHQWRVEGACKLLL